mmetsp:Transcript_30958/g.46697  ORF Transcript_30958/g.46697 Transcript_30958/m.46697 type:complete len:86 (-) Transcript_30958:55-312(-)
MGGSDNIEKLQKNVRWPWRKCRGMHVNERRSGRSSADRHVRLNYSILTLSIVSVVLRPSAMIDLNTIDVEGCVRQAPLPTPKTID